MRIRIELKTDKGTTAIFEIEDTELDSSTEFNKHLENLYKKVNAILNSFWGIREEKNGKTN